MTLKQIQNNDVETIQLTNEATTKLVNLIGSNENSSSPTKISENGLLNSENGEGLLTGFFLG